MSESILPVVKSRRGFASMSPEKRKQVASLGGKAAHTKGTAHEFNSFEASEAAKIGHQRKTAHEFTSAEAAVAGRKGGLAKAAKMKKVVLPPVVPPFPA
jgi:uncharacterized protein